ncbi:hypothetical protein CPB86DRAFT_869298 [Serendipita vermifera]|nr:hypothetical protein CPB86DRAFT_869298 [Serendipita vermifera]
MDHTRGHLGWTTLEIYRLKGSLPDRLMDRMVNLVTLSGSITLKNGTQILSGLGPLRRLKRLYWVIYLDSQIDGAYAFPTINTVNQSIESLELALRMESPDNPFGNRLAFPSINTARLHKTFIKLMLQSVPLIRHLSLEFSSFRRRAIALNTTFDLNELDRFSHLQSLELHTDMSIDSIENIKGLPSSNIHLRCGLSDLIQFSGQNVKQLTFTVPVGQDLEAGIDVVLDTLLWPSLEVLSIPVELVTIPPDWIG